MYGGREDAEIWKLCLSGNERGAWTYEQYLLMTERNGEDASELFRYCEFVGPDWYRLCFCEDRQAYAQSTWSEYRKEVDRENSEMYALLHAKCPECGNRMSYSTQSERFICPYCGHVEKDSTETEYLCSVLFSMDQQQDRDTICALLSAGGYSDITVSNGKWAFSADDGGSKHFGPYSYKTVAVLYLNPEVRAGNVLAKKLLYAYLNAGHGGAEHTDSEKSLMRSEIDRLDPEKDDGFICRLLQRCGYSEAKRRDDGTWVLSVGHEGYASPCEFTFQEVRNIIKARAEGVREIYGMLLQRKAT